MTTDQCTTTLRLAPGTCKTPRLHEDDEPMVAPNGRRVEEMLQEIAFVLHATRVVGRIGGRNAPKKG